MHNTNQNNCLIVYGHDYCPLSRRLKQALQQNHIAHEWRDVRAGESRFQDELKTLARGFLSVPTVIFPDGTVMIEPQPAQVLQKISPSPSSSSESSSPRPPNIIERFLKR